MTDAPPVLRGPRVTLRAPRPDDVDDRLAAGRDPEFRRMVGASRASPGPLTRADAERWYAELCAEPHGWVIALGERCIGVARLHGIDAAAGSAQLAIGIFSAAHRGQGLGTEAVRCLLSHAFEALALSVVRLRVLAYNAPAIACYARCGFREIAREPVVLNGEHVDDVWMAIMIEAWRAGAGPR